MNESAHAIRANQKTGSDEVSRAWILQAAAFDGETQCQRKRRIRDTQRGRWSVKSQMEDLLLLLADPTIITSVTSCRFFISWWFRRFTEDMWQLNNGRQQPAHLRLSAWNEIFKNTYYRLISAFQNQFYNDLPHDFESLNIITIKWKQCIRFLSTVYVYIKLWSNYDKCYRYFQYLSLIKMFWHSEKIKFQFIALGLQSFFSLFFINPTFRIEERFLPSIDRIWISCHSAVIGLL